VCVDVCVATSADVSALHINGGLCCGDCADFDVCAVTHSYVFICAPDSFIRVHMCSSLIRACVITFFPATGVPALHGNCGLCGGDCVDLHHGR